jgi:hypothetical protein
VLAAARISYGQDSGRPKFPKPALETASGVFVLRLIPYVCPIALRFGRRTPNVLLRWYTCSWQPRIESACHVPAPAASRHARVADLSRCMRAEMEAGRSGVAAEYQRRAAAGSPRCAQYRYKEATLMMVTVQAEAGARPAVARSGLQCPRIRSSRERAAAQCRAAADSARPASSGRHRNSLANYATSAAMASSRSSPQRSPTIWTPIGNPSASRAAGRVFVGLLEGLNGNAWWPICREDKFVHRNPHTCRLCSHKRRQIGLRAQESHGSAMFCLTIGIPVAGAVD